MNRTMRLIFLTVTMSLTLLATNADSDPGTQPATASEEAAIKAVLTRQQTSWDQGDVETFMQGYWNSPELTFAGRAVLRVATLRSWLITSRATRITPLWAIWSSQILRFIRLAGMPRWSSANGISRETLGMSAACLAWSSKNSPMAGKSCMTTPAKRWLRLSHD